MAKIIRKASIKRKTTETNINLIWSLDGSGKSKINTGIHFFDHMLDLFCHHGLFDLTLYVKGDLSVDYHHTVEDVGICMGMAFRKALNKAKGIERFASGLIPMDESLCEIAIDISGRPYFDWNKDSAIYKTNIFDTEAADVFFKAFTNNALITLHIEIKKSQNLHHMLESCFKGFGFYLSKAIKLNKAKLMKIPSTKGIL